MRKGSSVTRSAPFIRSHEVQRIATRRQRFGTSYAALPCSAPRMTLGNKKYPAATGSGNAAAAEKSAPGTSSAAPARRRCRPARMRAIQGPEDDVVAPVAQLRATTLGAYAALGWRPKDDPSVLLPQNGVFCRAGSVAVSRRGRCRTTCPNGIEGSRRLRVSGRRPPPAGRGAFRWSLSSRIQCRYRFLDRRGARHGRSVRL